MTKIFKECPEISQISSVKHGFFGKKGGVSSGDYNSLNCGYSSSDKTENVSKNRNIALSSLNLLTDKKVCGVSQVHSNKVVIVDDNFLNMSQAIEADGLVTDRNDVILSIITADCCPVLFVEPKAKIIGATHSGWRGAFSNILQNTVDKIEYLGGKRENIVATIGPSIAQKSYEVGKEFYQKFIDNNSNNAKYFIDSIKTTHFMFDLTGFAKDLLQNYGIKTNNLSLDTCSLENDFFSYRRKCLRNENDFGRNLTLIALDK